MLKPIFSSLSPKKYSGNALITALLMLTLIAITSTSLMQRVHLETVRTQHLKQTDQMHLLSDLITFWAMNVLTNAPLHAPDKDQPEVLARFPSSWAATYPGYQLSGELIDAQARLNINALTQNPMQPIFLRLIQQTQKNNSSPSDLSIEHMRLAAILDWITPAKNNTADKWSQYYLSLPQPYLQAHQPMQSIDELHRLAGFKTSLLAKILPELTALPEPTKINLNSVSLRLLSAMTENVSDAEGFLEWRQNHPPIQTAEVLQTVQQQFHFDANTLTFQSEFYLVNARVQYQKRSYQIQTLLKLDTAPQPSGTVPTKPTKSVHWVWQQLRLN
jgi:general secretion pathway protein K